MLAHELLPRRPPRRAGDDDRLVGRHRRRHADARRAVRRLMGGARAATTTTARLPVCLVVLLVSLVVYAVSFVLLRLLSRYRELCADRSGAYLTDEAGGAAPRPCRRSAARWPRDPDEGPARRRADERVLHRPGDQRVASSSPDRHPPVARAAARAARPDPAELGRPTAVTCGRRWASGRRCAGRRKPKQANLDALFRVPERGDHAADRRRASRPTGDRRRSATARPAGRPSRRPRTTSLDLIDDDAEAPDVERHARRRSASPGCVAPATRTTCPGCAPTCTPSTPRSRRRASAPGCCARWSPFADAAGRQRRLVYLYKQGHVLPLRADRPEDPRQPAGDPVRDALGGGAPDGAGPPAVARPLGRPRPVTPTCRRCTPRCADPAELHAVSADRQKVHAVKHDPAEGARRKH